MLFKVKKGKVDIYYVPVEHKKRKLTFIRWNEQENKWKVNVNGHGLNRLGE